MQCSSHCKGNTCFYETLQISMNSFQCWLTLVSKLQPMFLKVWSTNCMHQGYKATVGWLGRRLRQVFLPEGSYSKAHMGSLHHGSEARGQTARVATPDLSIPSCMRLDMFLHFSMQVASSLKGDDNDETYVWNSCKQRAEKRIWHRVK